jgi:hypothetical protein
MIEGPLEVTVLTDSGDREQQVLERAVRAAPPQGVAEDPAVLLLGGAPVTSGAELQLAHDLGFDVANQELGHDRNDSNAI